MAVTAQIIFPDQGAINTMWDPYQFSKGLVSHGSTHHVRGSKKIDDQSDRITGAGSEYLHLTESPLGWQPEIGLFYPSAYQWWRQWKITADMKMKC